MLGDPPAAADMCTIVGLELAGFKSYQDRVYVGPLGSFTCVVGPNGCGKSVFGEAIAFALGGSKSMLRVKNLSTLINEDVLKSDNPVAEVVLHLRRTSPSSPAAVEGSPQPATDGGTTLSIKRVLTPDKHTTCVRLAGRHGWTRATQPQLQELLKGYGIQTEAVDRYVITQSRHAVEVQDPVRLLHHLELLIGTSSYREQIDEQQQTLLQLAARLDCLEQEISSLEGTRAALAPAVQHWRSVKEQQADLLHRKHTLLTSQQQVLDQHKDIKLQQAAEATSQLEDLVAAAARAAEEVQQAEQAAQQLHQQAAAASKEKLAAEKTVSAIRNKLAAAELELKHLMEKQADRAQKEGRLQSRLSAATSSLQDSATELEQLQGQLAAAQQQLHAAQHAAAAAAATASAPKADVQNGEAVAGLEKQVRQAANLAAKEHAAKGQAAVKAEEHLQVASLLQQQLQDLQQLQQGHEQLQQQVSSLQEQQQAAAAAQQAAMRHWQAASERHQGLQVQLAELLEQSPHSTEGPRSTSAASSKFDSAIAVLQSQLQERLHGRLCNVAAVTEPTAEVAVAAALQETLNLSSTLITTDRAAAAAVCRCFQEHRIGRVTCKILEELPPAKPASKPQPDQQIQPLTCFVQPSSSCPGAQQLLQDLLGRWSLVSDRQAADQLLQRPRNQRKHYGNLVTRAGEVFKLDGEVVAGSSGPRSSATGGWGGYNLSSKVQPLPAEAAPGAVNHNQSGLHVQAAVPPAAEQQKQQAAQTTQVQQQVARAAAEEAAADAALQAAAAAAASLQHQLATAKAKLETVVTKLLLSVSNVPAPGCAAMLATSSGGAASQLSNLATRIHNLEGQLQKAWLECDAAASQAEAHQAAAAAADQHHAELHKQLAAAVSGPAPAGNAATTEASRAAQQQCQQLEREVAACKQQQRKLRAQAAAINKELVKVQQDQSQHRLDKLQAQVLEWQAGLAAAADSKAAALQSVQDLQKQVTRSKKHTEAAKATSTKAQHARTSHGVLLGQLQQELSEVEGHLLQITQQLQQLHPPPAGPTVPASGGLAHSTSAAANSSDQIAVGMEVDVATGAEQDQQQQDKELGHKCNTRARAGRAGSRRTVIDSSSSSSRDDDENMEASSDVDTSPVPRKKDQLSKLGTSVQKGAANKARHALNRRKPTSSSSKPKQQNLQVQLQQVLFKEQQLEAVAQQLQLEEAHLARAAGRVQRDALQQDLAALKRLRFALGELQAAEQQHAAAAAQQEALMELRYSKLAAALQLVNKPLSSTYCSLTGGVGDAYCSYSLDRSCLFREGVQLHVRPDQRKWRAAGSLSGGQQALVALALSFALQEVRPCPFCFFDEVDCALDTAAAARVAQYVTQHSASGRSQYLLVSHKPQVFEAAGCLVGVYGAATGQGSSAVVVQFTQPAVPAGTSHS